MPAYPGTAPFVPLDFDQTRSCKGPFTLTQRPDLVTDVTGCQP